VLRREKWTHQPVAVASACIAQRAMCTVAARSSVHGGPEKFPLSHLPKTEEDGFVFFVNFDLVREVLQYYGVVLNIVWVTLTYTWQNCDVGKLSEDIKILIENIRKGNGDILRLIVNFRGLGWTCMTAIRLIDDYVTHKTFITNW